MREKFIIFFLKVKNGKKKNSTYAALMNVFFKIFPKISYFI